MRTVELNGILTSLAGNYNHRNKNVRLYEIGNVYLPKALPLTELPEERKRLTLGMYGECDFFLLKGVLEEMFLNLVWKAKLILSHLRKNLSYIREDRHSFMWVELMLDLSDRYTLKCVKTTI